MSCTQARLIGVQPNFGAQSRVQSKANNLAASTQSSGQVSGQTPGQSSEWNPVSYRPALSFAGRTSEAVYLQKINGLFIQKDTASLLTCLEDLSASKGDGNINKVQNAEFRTKVKAMLTNLTRDDAPQILNILNTHMGWTKKPNAHTSDLLEFLGYPANHSVDDKIVTTNRERLREVFKGDQEWTEGLYNRFVKLIEGSSTENMRTLIDSTEGTYPFSLKQEDQLRLEELYFERLLTGSDLENPLPVKSDKLTEPKGEDNPDLAKT